MLLERSYDHANAAAVVLKSLGQSGIAPDAGSHHFSLHRVAFGGNLVSHGAEDTQVERLKIGKASSDQHRGVKLRIIVHCFGQDACKRTQLDPVQRRESSLNSCCEQLQAVIIAH